MKEDLKEILAPLEGYLESVDEEIKIMLTTGIPILDNSALHLFLKGGKKIRASLFLLSCGLKGDLPEGSIKLAAAVEIVHAATLIHDDIIDQSILRRGDITVPRKWGNKIAVLVGDYMYTVALDAIVREGNPALFPVIATGAKDMVKGELYQLQFSNIDSITKEHYFNIIELKTARFMSACTKIGALKAKLNDEECEKLSMFGLKIGFAFQIIDDTLDMINNDLTGKDTGNDFMDGKITLPFLYILEEASDNDKKMLKEYAVNPDTQKWNIIKKLLNNYDAIDYSIGVARTYIDDSLEIINQFPDSEYKEILIRLINFFINRKY